MVKSTLVSFSNYIFLNEDHQSKLIFFKLSPSRSQRPSLTQNNNNMAPSNALMVDKIINRFINPVLPKIDSKPTFEDIQIATHLLNDNAISIPSMASGGSPGHLGTRPSSLPRGWNPSIPTIFPSYQQARTPWMQLNFHACMLSAAVSTPTASM
jgi:hypothetical protein